MTIKEMSGIKGNEMFYPVEELNCSEKFESI
jgi:hypothetical protein